MIQVNYAEPSFKIKTEKDGKKYIFDGIRKAWLLLTEEEWVRQNFVQHLIAHLKYPASFIALEKEIVLNELKKRFDILIYDRQHKPWLLVECKAPAITLNDAVLQQVLRYNMSVPVEFMILTNGNQTYGWKKEAERLEIINELPAWQHDNK